MNTLTTTLSHCATKCGAKFIQNGVQLRV